MPYETEKQVAIEAVTRAAQLCLAVQAELVNVDSLEKGDKSPVTVADFGAQAVVCQHVTANFPEAVIVGEEDSRQLRTPDNAAKLAQVTGYVQQFFPQADAETVCGWIDAGNGQVADRFWTLDPIDGTKGFLRNDQYGIALALIEQGQVKVAALAGPVLPVDLNEPDGAKGVVFVAVRGEGAAVAPLNSAEFTVIHVVPVTHPENVRFAESVEAGHGDQALQEALAKAAGISTPPLRMDSQVKYGAVARGDAALYLRLPSPKQPGYREKIWDHAAGSLIVEEAGGRVTDMYGRPLDFGSDYKMNDNRGVIVSNGELHEVVLKALTNQ